MADPRILAIMGSGETAPTMARVHRALSAKIGDQTAPATLIDTTYGFQENADILSTQISEWFVTHIGRPMTVASYRRADVSERDAAAAVARIRAAPYVMAGPGSPSYTLRHWRASPIPAQLEEKLTSGGIVVMASAAALALGRLTVPVYEIYKVGAEPVWLEGLDLLGHLTGLSAAIIPHYDNAEGRDHDTHFSYIGERRLTQLEELMPAGTFIIGVDSHTALLLDLDEHTAAVAGRGGITLRVRGHSIVLQHGRTLGLAELAEHVDRLQGLPLTREAHAQALEQPAIARDSLPATARRIEAAFERALATGDVTGMTAAVLDLELAISRIEAVPHDSRELADARQIFRSLLVRLGSSVRQTRADADAIAPYVEALVELRASARAAGDWQQADLIRDRLRGAGVEIHDEPDERTTWALAEARPVVSSS